jgi:Helix-turn-helix domain
VLETPACAIPTLSQAKAAPLLSINQPKVSALSRYRLEGFSVERLMRFLTSLDQDVEIVIRNKPRTRCPGQVFATAAQEGSVARRHRRKGNPKCYNRSD